MEDGVTYNAALSLLDGWMDGIKMASGDGIGKCQRGLWDTGP